MLLDLVKRMKPKDASPDLPSFQIRSLTTSRIAAKRALDEDGIIDDSMDLDPWDAPPPAA
jgi:hypothetical protein